MRLAAGGGAHLLVPGGLPGEVAAGRRLRRPLCDAGHAHSAAEPALAVAFCLRRSSPTSPAGRWCWRSARPTWHTTFQMSRGWPAGVSVTKAGGICAAGACFCTGACSLGLGAVTLPGLRQTAHPLALHAAKPAVVPWLIPFNSADDTKETVRLSKGAEQRGRCLLVHATAPAALPPCTPRDPAPPTAPPPAGLLWQPLPQHAHLADAAELQRAPLARGQLVSGGAGGGHRPAPGLLQGPEARRKLPGAHRGAPVAAQRRVAHVRHPGARSGRRVHAGAWFCSAGGRARYPCVRQLPAKRL